MNHLREISGALTVVLTALVYVPLIISTARGRLKPHPVTWAVVALSTGANSVILLFNDAGPGVWGQASATVCNLVLAVVSFVSYRRLSRITRRDVVFFLLAITALVLWLISRNLAAISVVLLTVSSVLGFVPTFTKTWDEPRSESFYTWSLLSLMAVFGVIATTSPNFVNLFQRTSNIFLNTSLLMIMVVRRRKPSPNNPGPRTLEEERALDGGALR